MNEHKFKVGDKIIRIKGRYANKQLPFKITRITNGKYVVSNSNGIKNLHLGMTEIVDKQFELEEIYNSPLYKLLAEEELENTDNESSN